eukprot:985133-Alexandrium_andersonii.AAC.1
MRESLASRSRRAPARARALQVRRRRSAELGAPSRPPSEDAHAAARSGTYRRASVHRAQRGRQPTRAWS